MTINNADASFDSMATLHHSLQGAENVPRTTTIGHVMLQHGTLDLSLTDLQADPILTPHVDLGQDLLLESATFGKFSIIVTPTIEFAARGTPTIYVNVSAEGPAGHGLNDLRTFWATVADQAAPAYAALLGPAIERAINVTANAIEEEAAASVD